MNTIKHITLTDAKAADIERLVFPPLHGNRSRLRRFFRQLQQPGQRTAALLPSTRIDLRLSVIEEGDFPILDVEAEPLLPERQAPLIPEAAAHGDVSRAELLDLKTDLPCTSTVDVILPERFVGNIATIDIGHDVGDPSFGGGGDDFAVRGWGSHDGKGDNEKLLAAESGDERFIVFVIHFRNFDAAGQITVAGGASQGRDGVVTGFQQLFDKMLA